MSAENGSSVRGLRTIRAAVILAGTLAFIFGLRTFGRSYSMTRWPITPGRVVTSVVAEEAGRVQARVEYEYMLAGRVYRGSVPASSLSREAADSLAARYPVGREIAVGYDPGNPRQSVLRADLRWWSLALTLAGVCIMAAGIWPRKP